MNPHSDVIASNTKQSRAPRLPRHPDEPSGLLAMTVGLVAHEALPVLLVLYPLLLLLDDLEPGFVRSVVNPHWFLVAMIVAGIAAGKNEATPSRSPSTAVEGEKEKSFPPSRREGGYGGVARITFTSASAIVVGLWVWWRLHAGTLGIVVALLAAIAVGTVVLVVYDSESSS